MALSAFLTGIGGSLFAQYFLYLDPTLVISPELSFQFALLPAVGGLGTAIGPVLGSFLDHAAVRAAALLSRPCGARPASRHLRRRRDRRDALFPERHCRRARPPQPHPTKRRRHDRAAGGPQAQPRVRAAVGGARRELRGAAGRAARPDRPERRRQEHALQPDRRRVAADRRRDRCSRAAASRGWKPYHIARAGIARTFQIPKPYRHLIRHRERDAQRHAARQKRRRARRELAEATLADVGLADYAGAPVEHAHRRPAQAAGGGARAGAASRGSCCSTRSWRG